MLSTRFGLWSVVREELASYPGRFSQSIQMTVLCMLIVAVSMSLQVPEAAISCYLVFFAARDNAGSAIKIGFALIVAASIGILLAFVFLMLSADEPGLRLLLIVLFTFAGMFFSQASKAGPIAATVGFVFAFALTFYDEVPDPELLTRGLAWMWVVVFFPMFFMIILHILAGSNPAKLVRAELAQRIAVTADIIRVPDVSPEPISQLLTHGNEQVLDWYKSARFLSKMSPLELARTEELIAASFSLIAYAEAAREIGTTWEGQERDDLLARLALVEAAVVKGDTLRTTSPAQWQHADGLGKREIDKTIGSLERILSSDYVLDAATAVETAKEPLLAADAFTNPVYTKFALKSLLAVMVCYFTYTGLHWFEIHTAMVTGYYVALGTTGETIHKLTLRIAGALIGAVMGIGSILFIMPHMTDIGDLLLLVGVGAFLSAWVANGSKRIQYVGWQMALCFFLTVLHGFGPSYDLGVASSRVLGILFGNVVMTLVFTHVWPVSIASAVGKQLSNALSSLSEMLDTVRANHSELQAFYPQVEAAGRSHELHVFELERDHEDITRNARLLNEISELASPALLLVEAPYESPIFEQHIPVSIQHAFALFRDSVTDFLRDCSITAIDGNPTHKGVDWSGDYAQLQTTVAREWRSLSGTLGAERPSVLTELRARLLLCKRIDGHLSRVAADWS